MYSFSKRVAVEKYELALAQFKLTFLTSFYGRRKQRGKMAYTQ